MEKIFDMVTTAVEASANRSLLTGVPFSLTSPASWAVTLLAGLRQVRTQVRELAVSLLPEDVRPNVTGLDIGTILEALATHPDVLGFLGSLRRLVKSEAAATVKQALENAENSTESET
jgi:hypothetical protein